MHRSLVLLTASIGLANAQISFGPSQEIGDSMATGLAFAKATDMDGDGDLDVVATEELGIRVLWWENGGSGNFDERHEWTWDEWTLQTGVGGFDFDVIGFEDWDDDGKIDVWIETRDSDPNFESPVTRTIKVAVNDGDGIFSDPIDVGVFEESQEATFVDTFLVDLDGDGSRDIVTGGGIYWLRQNANLEAAPFNLPLFEDSNLWVSRASSHLPQPCDYDGDGDLDVIAVPPFNTIPVLVENLGATGYGPAVPLLSPNPDGSDYPLRIAILPNQGSAEIWVLEEDYVAGSTSLVHYPLGTGGNLGTRQSLPLPADDNGVPIQWGDIATIDPHTLMLAAFGGSSPDTRFYKVDASAPSPSPTFVHQNPGISECRLIRPVDLDGNLQDDLFLPLATLGGVSGSTRSRIDWLPADPIGGGYLEARSIMRGLSNPVIYTSGDLDGNGSFEILLGSSKRFLRPIRGVDLLSVASPGAPGQPWNTVDIPIDRDRFDIVAEVDLEGDFVVSVEPHQSIHCSSGRADFLIQTYQPIPSTPIGYFRFEWLLQDDSGAFHLKTLTEDYASGLISAAYIDWDGDTIPDLLSDEPSNIGMMIALRRGTGISFGPTEPLFEYPSGANAGSGYFPFQPAIPPPVLRDVDWDGDLDVIGGFWQFPNSPNSWLENDGAGNFISLRAFPEPISPIPADLDGDGHNDYVTRPDAFGPRPLLARPGVSFEPLSETRIINWRSTFLDVDGDGDADTVFPTPTNGISGFHRMFWLENLGDGIFSPKDEMAPGHPAAPVKWAQRDRSATADVDGDGVPDLIVASSTWPRLEWLKITRTPQPQAFTDQMATAGISGHSAGPLSDWDLDGIPNWDEFAFGSDVAIPDPNHPGRPKLEAGPSGLSYTFQRRSDAATLGMSYDKFRSEDLASWNPWTPAETTDIAAPGYERVSFPINPGLPAEFFKTVVSDPE